MNILVFCRKNLILYRDIINLAAKTLVTKAIGASGTLLLGLVLARLYGAEGVGTFMLGLSLIIGVGVLLRFGINDGILKFGGVAFYNHDGSMIKAILATTFFNVFFIGFLACLVLLSFRVELSLLVMDGGELVDIFPPLLFCLPFYTYLFVLGSLYRAINESPIAPVFETGFSSLFSALNIFIYESVFPGSTLLEATWIFALSTFILFLLGVFTFLKKISILNSLVSCEGDALSSRFREFLRHLPDYFLISLANYCSQWGIVLLGGFFLTASSIGVFSTVNRVAFLINFILMIFNGVLGPRFAVLCSARKYGAASDLYVFSSLVMFFIALLPAAVLIIFGKDILVFFGEEFVEGYYILVALVISQLVNVGTGAVGSLLNMSGRQKVMRNLSLFTSFSSIAIAVVLFQLLGIWGLAFTTIYLLVVQNLAALFFANKVFGFCHKHQVSRNVSS
ncbi:hypothetical protein [Onishia niordana]|uniref:hypothetical protein n=1 Tax=Onishia niordana TaxID=2508711 RepID=UPI00109F5069|nr:hypothetical protein [Halomonas niordiana]